MNDANKSPFVTNETLIWLLQKVSINSGAKFRDWYRAAGPGQTPSRLTFLFASSLVGSINYNKNSKL